MNLFLFHCQVREYDYYGAYDVKEHQDYKYNELLGQDYTFDFPPHHDIVRNQVKYYYR